MNCQRIITLATLSLALLSTPARAQDKMAELATSFDAGNAMETKYSIWNGNYDKTHFEFVLGYVNKSWRCTYDSFSQREDFFGDPDDKYIHGFQIGALFTPSFDWGLGLRTGIFLETYTSRSKWITDYCNHWAEMDLYIPAHATFRIPFTQECALNIFAGPGFQLAMDGKYYKQVGTVWRPWRRPSSVFAAEKQEYGNGWPHRVNWQADCGINFRFKMVTISFTYSFGLNNHGIENTFDGGKTFVTATSSYQDKMQASISISL